MNNSLIKSFLLLFLIGFQTTVKSQILDDSTKLVYSLKTVGYRYESAIFYNDTTFQREDSLLNAFQTMNRNEEIGMSFQDLGNSGTATKSLFLMPRQSAATQFGFSSFDLYRVAIEKVKYYDTKSPFTKMEYVQSNRGNADLRFVHAQNIKPKLNVTVDIQRISASKQFDLTTNREERLINGWNFILSSNFSSLSNKYILLTHINHLNFQQIEQGGIFETNNQEQFGNVTLYDAKVTGASSRTFKNTYYAYQQLKLSNGFDTFHQFEYQQNRVGFYNNSLQANNDSTFYKSLTVEADTINWRYKNSVIQNTFGLKGHYKKLLGSLYFSQRYFDVVGNIDSTNKYNNRFYKINEFFIGGDINFRITKLASNLNAKVEIKLPSTKNPTIGYNISANLNLKDFKLGLVSSSFTPDFVFLRSAIPGFLWNNEEAFKNQTNLKLFGSFEYATKKFTVNPTASLQFIDNYTFFNANSLPEQLNNESLTVFSTGFKIATNLKRFYIENELILNVSKAAYYPIPLIINNTDMYFKFNYAKVLDIRIGADNHYRSAYNGQLYNPLIQQFYLQSKNTEQAIWNFPLMNAYTSFKVNKVRLAFKFTNFIYTLNNLANVVRTNNKTVQYFSTPNFPGLRNGFFIHIDWPLFD